MAEPMRQPQPGDLGLAPGGGLAMAVVRWGTGAARLRHGRFWRHPALYGHAALCIKTAGKGPGEVTIIEATPNDGIVQRNVPIARFDWSTGGPLTEQFDAGIAQRQLAVEIMTDLLGRPYDWPNIARFVAEFAWPGFPGSEDRDNAKAICSEATTWALRGAGATVGVLGEKKPAGRVAPNSCAPIMDFWPKTQPGKYGL